MIIVLFIMKFIIPLSSDVRIYNLLIIVIYTIVGGLVYFGLTYKNKVVKNVFGKKVYDYIKKITSFR